MFRKCLSVFLAFVILFSIPTIFPVAVTAKKVDIAAEGAKSVLAETGYDPYAVGVDGNWANCTYWAWKYANDAGYHIPDTWGDGGSWYSNAQNDGYYCDKNPSANSIMCTSSGIYGHVAYVTDYDSANGRVYIKQGGVRGTSDGRSEGWVSANPGDLQGYIHLSGGDTHYGAENVNFDGTNASNISFFNATIGCWMRNPNSYNIRAYGFYLGTDQDNLVQYTIGKNVKWTDSYIQANLSNYVGRLSQGVTYYYRFFSLTDGYNLCPVYSFTTSGNSTITFDNVVSSNIDNDNMSIECWVRNHQGLNINKYGLYYGTSVSGMNVCIEVGKNVSWTDFHIRIKIIDQNIELKPNTTYYYQFFALTDGWNYSYVNSFTTGNYVPTPPPTQPPTVPLTNPPTTPPIDPPTDPPTTPPTEPPTVAKFILGDTDGDGEVTILDATAIQRHLASLPTRAYNEKAADADGDKEVTILDATAIQRHLASLPTNERIGALI